MLDLYFVLTPRFLMLDFAGPAEAFAFAALEGARVRTHYVGASPSMEGALGLSVGRLEPLPAAMPDGSLVFISGVMSPAKSYRCTEAEQTVAWLRDVVTPRHRVACICSAAILAGRAGLLDDRECTTHHTLTEALREVSPRARVLDDRLFVEDGPIATSAGVTAGVDLALHMIQSVAGPRIALAVARELVVWLRRTGSDPQLSPWLAFRDHLHPAVHRVQDAISRAPARAWSLPELAKQSHASVRNLTRLFREHTGTSIGDYHQTLQVALARQLLDNRNNSMERVAELSGFGSPRAMRRVFAKVEGQSPSASAAVRREQR